MTATLLSLAAGLAAFGQGSGAPSASVASIRSLNTLVSPRNTGLHLEISHCGVR